MKKILVQGAGGFIGHNLVSQLKKEGYWVRGVDLKYPEFEKTKADDFIIIDLRDQYSLNYIYNTKNTKYDEIFQLAASMGGSEFVFTKKNDAMIMYDNALINLNTIFVNEKIENTKIFYSSSACIYPQENQEDPNNPNCSEDSAYPANPDSDYGMEKLFSERLFLAFHRNKNMDIRIARLHNIFGINGCYEGGREKAPAAICRKVALVENGGEIEIFGDGNQTRSFLYIDDCLEGMKRLMDSDFIGPVNIGSEEMVTINQLVEYIAEISEKKIKIKHINGPIGVKGRNSDNRLIKEKLGWEPTYSLKKGLKKTYEWIAKRIKNE